MQCFLQVIALNLAEQLVNKGLFEDAIMVYDIADVSIFINDCTYTCDTFFIRKLASK